MTTPKQQQARSRNWLIFRLRSLYSQADLLSYSRAVQLKKLVDTELIELHAEPETDKRRRALESYL